MKKLTQFGTPLLLIVSFFISAGTTFASSLTYHQPIYRVWEESSTETLGVDEFTFGSNRAWAWKADGSGNFDNVCFYFGADEGAEVVDATLSVYSRGETWPPGPSSAWPSFTNTLLGTSEDLTFTPPTVSTTTLPYEAANQNGFERHCFQFSSQIHYDDEEALLFQWSKGSTSGTVYVLAGNNAIDPRTDPTRMVLTNNYTTDSWVGQLAPFQLWVGDPADFIQTDGNYTTHVIRINEPQAKTTTISNNVVFEFDYYTKYLLDDTHADAYGLVLYRPSTGEYMRLDNWETFEQPDLISGSAPVINLFEFDFSHTVEDAYRYAGAFYAEPGSYQLTILLYSVTGDCEASCTFSPLGEGKTVNFSVITNEFPNDPLYTDDYAGQYGTYSADMCDLNLNPFEESTFSVSGCAGYLFIPQENTFSQYTQVKSDLATRKPFSYMVGVQTTWNELSASSTASSTQTQFALHDLGIGSTTAIGNFLPNATVFSSSTVRHYLPDPIFNALLALAVAALWLTFFGVIFFETKYLLQKL